MSAAPIDADSAQPGSLRMRLRTQTRREHELTEQAFEAFDIATRSGLLRFLLAHRYALTGLQARISGGPDAAPEIAVMLDMIQADLQMLEGTEHDLPPYTDHEALHPLGVRYVLLGSRLGSQILAKRVVESPEKNLHQAGTYLADKTLMSAWKDLLHALEATDAALQSEDIRMSAAETFGLFRLAAEKVQQAAG